MPDSPSDGVRLLAEGSPITLKDGREYRLIFDFEAFCRLEDMLGSLDAFTDALAQRGFGHRRLNPLRAGLLAALSHYRDPAQPDAALRQRTDREWAALFRFSDSGRYALALSDAFVEGMGVGDLGEALGQVRRAAGSPGASSTSPPRSRSARATASSGG